MGRNASHAERQLAANTHVLGNRQYYEDGLALIAKHYGLEMTAEGFWIQLATSLLQEHVPYFMPPARRGAPKKLQAFFPLLHSLMIGVKSKQLNMTADEVFEKAAGMLHSNVETVRREYWRWSSNRGKNSEK